MNKEVKPSEPKNIALFLRGGPGVGKSSVLETLVQRIPLSARVEVDELRYMVVGGLVASKSELRPGDYPDEYARQCRLGDENAFALARNLVNAGFIPVVAGLNGGESANTFRLLSHPEEVTWYPDSDLLAKKLPRTKVFQIVLDASTEVITSRLKERDWPSDVIEFVLAQRELFLVAVRSTKVDLFVDTSTSSAESVAEHIIEELSLDDRSREEPG